MEYFTGLLKTVHTEVGFQFHPKCKKKKQNIVQLNLADDLLLFCRGDKIFVMHLFSCFKEFSNTSGFIANIDKSCIHFGGVQEDIRSNILEAPDFAKGELPFRYLGVPLSTKRISIVQCKPLIDKILHRVTN